MKMYIREIKLLLTLVALSSCNSIHQKTSDTKIINGTYISGNSQNKANAVVSIFSRARGAGSGAACTGTIVSDNTVITAAHCVENKILYQEGNYQSCVSNAIYKNICSTKIIMHDKYRSAGIQNDLAFIVYPNGTFRHYAELRGQQNSVQKELVWMVGYSDLFPNTQQSASTQSSKRWGKNTVVNPNSSGGYIYTLNRSRTGTVGLSEGDSGGPLFGTDCRIIGIASHGKEGYSNNFHSNLTAQNYFQWLLEKRTFEGAYFCGLSGNDPQRCNPQSKFTYTEAFGKEEFPCAAPTDTPGGAMIAGGQNSSNPARIYLAVSRDPSSKNINLLASLAAGASTVFVCKADISTENCINSPEALNNQSGSILGSRKLFRFDTKTAQLPLSVRIVAINDTKQLLATRTVKISQK